MKVKFYFKAGCWLCGNCEEQLNGIKGKYPIEVERIDIESSDELYELYRFDIPVVEFEDGTTLYGRIRKDDLLRAIHDNSK